MVWNLFLMLAWAAFWNDFTAQSLLIGFLIGYVILAVFAARGFPGPTRYVIRTRRSVSFFGFYLKELILSNITMAADVLRPKMTMRPAVVAIPLERQTNSDVELTLLANLISLTPGTLSIDFSADRSILYVHTMDIPGGDLDAFRAKLKHDFERRVLEVLH
jgi:multicomponent Na+:H+ antiporter subunit E